MNQTLRRPAVAGQFYPADPLRLRADVERFLSPVTARRRAVALVVPHAGYLYSGGVAGEAFASVDIPARVVVLAVNHRGVGCAIAGFPPGWWETPLGRMEVDAELTEAIASRAPALVLDPRAHQGEHSLEVELPFLQVGRRPPPRIVPISISSHDLAELEELGHAVAGAVRSAGEEVLIVASTDFTHYQPAVVARAQDRLAIDRILAVDGPGLLRTVFEHQISMCGVAPTTAALVAARELGARSARLLRYATSGDVTGDDESVVGYAGLVVGEEPVTRTER